MSDEHEHPEQKPPKKSWWLSFPGFITIIFLIAIGYYLITEHHAHLFNILPLLILLLCPFYKAQWHHQIATTGLYAKVRHPQYDGFIIIMLGFLLQWPTIMTLIMFPILVYVYIKLAYSEENVVLSEFGDE